MNNIMKKCSFCIDIGTKQIYNNTRKNERTLCEIMFTTMHQRRRNVKCYKPEKVNKDLPGIILLSHGPFAVSLVDTAKMLFGESENIAAYSLEPGDDIDKYREAFVEMINEFPEGSMILVDLFGGTPCNQVMRHIQETEKPLEVVGGMNLPMLVNAVLAREGISGKDFSLDTVENGKNGIFRVDTEGFLSDDDDEDDE